MPQSALQVSQDFSVICIRRSQGVGQRDRTVPSDLDWSAHTVVLSRTETSTARIGVRNPIDLGLASGWIGLWVVFGHADQVLIAPAAAFALGVHLFVVFYEDPTLRRKFGADYEEYCREAIVGGCG